jgi:two-component system NtrC family response regulator
MQEAMVRSNGNLSVAARLLGVSRPTLYGLLEAHGMATETVRATEAAAAIEPTTLNEQG